MFTRALVRTPSTSLAEGLTTANLGKPDYDKAIDQHTAYIQALESCGLSVEILPPLDEYPDSCFIEDVALLTPACAIITRPGAPSRLGEISGISQILSEYYQVVEQIWEPGTVEGGDILMVGSHFYIGISERTNPAGAGQIIDILTQYGMTGSFVPLQETLHLKTSVAYLEDRNLIASGEMLTRDEFVNFKLLPVPEEESYAANCIWVNGTVLVPADHPRTSGIIRGAGYKVLEVDLSEFQKLDGGLSCLSLRF